MAHFVKLDDNNIVVDGYVIHNNELKDNEGNEQEILGIKFCVKLFGEGNYKQTSYNTRKGIYYESDLIIAEDQSKAFRKNYAGLGWTYDETRDAFISYKPYPSWILNENSCWWEAPIPQPDDGLFYFWDEETTSWIIIPEENAV